MHKLSKRKYIYVNYKRHHLCEYNSGIRTIAPEYVKYENKRSYFKAYLFG